MKSIYLIAASMATVALAAPQASLLAQGTGQADTQASPQAAAPAAAMANRKFGEWGVDLSARDTSVTPGDSFFDYANGSWYKAAQFSPQYPVTGIMLDLHERTQGQLRAVIEDSARNPRSETARKVGGLYASFMDEARLQQLDAKPLQQDLDAVRKIKSHSAMAAEMGRSHFGFGSSFFNLGVIPDLKGPKIYTAAMGPGGMGLPDRDYYLTDQFKAQREAYVAHIARTLTLGGWPNADAAAQAILAMETRIAEASWTRTEQRDPNKAYNVMTPAQLRAFAPAFDWPAYFNALGLSRLDRLIVSQNTAVPKIAAIYAATPLDTLKAWQAFRTINQASPYLSNRFVENNFRFAAALSGQQANQPRWQRAVSLVNGSLGEALGQEYVTRHFPASSKKMMEEMVSNLQNAMRARIEGADWMSAETRATALKKLSLQRVKVGYPDKWRDYSDLKIDPNDLYGNVERAGAFGTRFEFNRLGKPVDREEWAMTPQTLNAYFNPLGNEIVFPAAFLQGPMFDPSADPAVNYGAIGAVIGHEISHGFDDTGRKFDEVGTLRDWWKPEDAARFNTEAGKLADQYGSYEGAPDMKVNGRLTLGENIGDQGGVRIALDAYHKTLGGRPAPVIGGMSGDQRFFLGWAQAWRNKMRPEMTKMVLVSDVHSPDRWRVDGTLRNIDEWYAAFDVKPGQKLYLKPEERVRVW
jgi:putative endopeptidase